MREDELPRSAIRPYPQQLVGSWTTKDGNEVVIRPIRPEDEPLLIKFHEKLSERSVYLRYFQPLKFTQRVAHERLSRICFIDYDREMVLVAERPNASGEPEILAVGRLSKLHGLNEGELAAVAVDAAQHKGLGTELYRRLINVAREERLGKLISNMLPENKEMRALCVKLGFKMFSSLEDNMIRAELTLSS
jgi:acetyltransferase